MYMYASNNWVMLKQALTMHMGCLESIKEHKRSIRAAQDAARSNSSYESFLN